MAGCFSRTVEKSRQTGQELGIDPDRCYATYEEMAKAEAARPDGIRFVVVVTPNVSHYPVCKAFLEAGIPVACDKPLCLTVEQSEELQRLADMAKAGKKRKNEVYEEIEAMRKDYRHSGIERLTERAMDLHLYAEAVQFLYNAGYPMPKENSLTGDTGDTCDMRLEKLAASRIKTIPLALMDLYFSRKEISFETISAANRMTPHQVARSEDMAGEIEEMYDFACENEMKSAVIPLLIDNDTGSGLYIIGKSYLKSWDFDKERKRTVLKILNGRPCCYAIVKFLNIETGKTAADDPYVWSPYSVVDMITESGEINPENILFSDLDEALDIYQGQLNAKAQGILYDNFREANWFDEEENAELIPEMYRRYFYVPEPEDADADMEDVRAEYDRLCREEFSVQKRT